MESCNMSSTFSRAAAFIVIVASGCSQTPPPMQAPQVTVAPAIEREIADWDEFTGHFEAVNSVDVRPRVGGFLQRVGFVEGAMVRQGDVLFVIDQRPYEAEVARAEAVLAQARTRNQHCFGSRNFGSARTGAHAQSARRSGSRACAEADEHPGDLARRAGRADKWSRRGRRRRACRPSGAASGAI